MINYKLLTPGPLTTTDTVKKVMMVDHCTWDNDYKQITQEIRQKLLDIAHVSNEKYTTVLMQGSGTFGVESVITSAVGSDEKILFIANGAYGERMSQIAKKAGVNHIAYNCHYNEQPNLAEIEEIIKNDAKITHVAIVHSETTSGILNNITDVAKLVKAYNLTFIVDAMSSFGGVDIDVDALGIDFIISSANKCIQGVPGFSFIICKKDSLEKCKDKARSLSLDLYDQWVSMDKDGKWRFTSPTHIVLAFAEALKELEAEGGVKSRQERYEQNNKILIDRMTEMGIKTYVDRTHQSPIITTFFSPEGVVFEDMYAYVKARGYAIYPGKVTESETFRIGNIGEIYADDMNKLCDIFAEYFAK
ncbi:MAG: 2-aminoethylphosphonate--pyruvate transaminase [Clostridia bacterium]